MNLTKISIIRNINYLLIFLLYFLLKEYILIIRANNANKSNH